MMIEALRSTSRARSVGLSLLRAAARHWPAEALEHEARDGVRRRDDDESDDGVLDLLLRLLHRLRVPAGRHPEEPGVNQHHEEHHAHQSQGRADQVPDQNRELRTRGETRRLCRGLRASLDIFQELLREHDPRNGCGEGETHNGYSAMVHTDSLWRGRLHSAAARGAAHGREHEVRDGVRGGYDEETQDVVLERLPRGFHFRRVSLREHELQAAPHDEHEEQGAEDAEERRDDVPDDLRDAPARFVLAPGDGAHVVPGGICRILKSGALRREPLRQRQAVRHGGERKHDAETHGRKTKCVHVPNYGVSVVAERRREITKPVMAQADKMIAKPMMPETIRRRASCVFSSFPPDTMYLNPPMSTITTAMIPRNPRATLMSRAAVWRTSPEPNLMSCWIASTPRSFAFSGCCAMAAMGSASEAAIPHVAAKLATFFMRFVMSCVTSFQWLDGG